MEKKDEPNGLWNIFSATKTVWIRAKKDTRRGIYMLIPDLNGWTKVRKANWIFPLCRYKLPCSSSFLPPFFSVQNWQTVTCNSSRAPCSNSSPMRTNVPWAKLSCLNTRYFARHKMFWQLISKQSNSTHFFNGLFFGHLQIDLLQIPSRAFQLLGKIPKGLFQF